MAVSNPEIAGGQKEFEISLDHWKKMTERQKWKLKGEFGGRVYITDPSHEWPFDSPEKRYTPPEWLVPSPKPENLFKIFISDLVSRVRRIPNILHRPDSPGHNHQDLKPAI